jgi:hypothetical protein
MACCPRTIKVNSFPLPQLCGGEGEGEGVLVSPHLKRLCRNYMLVPYIPSPLSKGRRRSPALSHCDIPPFTFLEKQGGTLCINQRIRPRSTAQNKPEVPLWAECGVPPRAGDAERRQMRGYNKKQYLQSLSWTPLPHPLPTVAGRGRYLKYDTVTQGERNIVELIF